MSEKIRNHNLPYIFPGADHVYGLDQEPRVPGGLGRDDHAGQLGRPQLFALPLPHHQRLFLRVLCARRVEQFFLLCYLLPHPAKLAGKLEFLGSEMLFNLA